MRKHNRYATHYIENRAVIIARYIVKNDATVREAANKYGCSKTTAHIDVTKRLPEINATLANSARLTLEKHKAERHLRGGEATRRKYAIRKCCNGC